jgi:hypothetical protein
VNKVDCALLPGCRDGSVFRFLVGKLQSLADTGNFGFRNASVFSVVKHDLFQVSEQCLASRALKRGRP